jgi:hypothetical protein
MDIPAQSEPEILGESEPLIPGESEPAVEGHFLRLRRIRPDSYRDYPQKHQAYGKCGRWG